MGKGSLYKHWGPLAVFVGSLFIFAFALMHYYPSLKTVVEPVEDPGVITEFAITPDTKIELRSFLDGVYTFRHHSNRGVTGLFFDWWPETLKVFLVTHPDVVIIESMTAGIYHRQEDAVEYWEQVSVLTVKKGD